MHLGQGAKLALTAVQIGYHRRTITKLGEVMRMKTMVVATDGSEHARKAVTLAADLASKSDARLVLVHVLLRGELSEDMRHLAEVEYHTREGGKTPAPLVPLGRYPANIVPSDVARDPTPVLQTVGEQILKEAKQIAKDHGVTKVDTRIEDGDVVKRLLSVVEEVDADILVTGSRGLSNLKGMLAGSVSHKLSNMSPVTCISVR